MSVGLRDRFDRGESLPVLSVQKWTSLEERSSIVILSIFDSPLEIRYRNINWSKISISVTWYSLSIVNT